MAQVPNIRNKNKREIVQLRGINYSNILQDGDLADCKNISVDKFPYITTAKKVTVLSGTGYENVKALTSYQNLITFADDNGNGKMYLDGNEYTELPSSEKQTIIVNGKMLVLPDEELIALKTTYTVTLGDTSNVCDINKLYSWFNSKCVYATGTHSFYTWGGERTVAAINEIRYRYGPTSYVLYKITDGGDICYNRESRYFSVDADEFIAVKWTVRGDNVYWLDTPVKVTGCEEFETPQEGGGMVYLSNPENVLNGYIENVETVGICDTTILALSAETPQIRKLSSISAKCVGYYGDGYSFNKNIANFLNINDVIEVMQGSTSQIGKIIAISGDYIMRATTIDGQAEIDFSLNKWHCFKKLEEPDFACEWANRLWCCNSDKQLIYASSQGKPDDFLSDFESAIGAYQITIGDVEPFTGCIKYESSILFFKQNRIYKIMGSSPKNYEIFTYETEGVKQGCHKSLCTINGILYYVGLHGVYAYSGGVPVLISANLGNMEMENAVGGTDGERYYLSFTSDGKDYLFTYEPRYNIWLLRDNVKAVDFARKLEDFYYLDKNTKKVIKMDTADTPDDMEWYAQFTPFYETIDGKKRYTKLIIRYELGNKSHMTVKMRADDGIWQEVEKLTAHDKKGTQELILPIMRCDKLELRLEGKGKATILEIAREFEVGSGV